MTPREHIEAVRARVPDMRGVDVDVWEAAIADWSTPLPKDRPWRLRHNLPIAQRAAANPRWADRAPDPLDDLALAVIDQLDAARAAWWHLRDVGLVTAGDDDLVTATLRGAA